MRILGLGKKRDATTSLVGRVIQVGSYHLHIEGLLGEGGFASIYNAVETRSEQAFALKHFRLGGDGDAASEVRTEVRTMQKLVTFPEILKLRAFQESDDEAFVLLDLCHGSLPDWLARRGRPSRDQVLEIFGSVCRAVAHMHEQDPPIAHRDLKAENVLLHHAGVWVLCDFGSCSTTHGACVSAADIGRAEDDIRKRTTPAYRAPEMWDLYAREFMGPPVDIWALGCLLYLLICGRLPFDGDSKLQILVGKYPEMTGTDEGLSTIVRACLRVKPLERPSAQVLALVVDLLQGGGDAAAVREVLGGTAEPPTAKPVREPEVSAARARAAQAPAAPLVRPSPTRVPQGSGASLDGTARWASFGAPSAQPPPPPTPSSAADAFFDSAGWATFGGIQEMPTSGAAAPTSPPAELPEPTATPSHGSLLDEEPPFAPSGGHALLAAPQAAPMADSTLPSAPTSTAGSSAPPSLPDSLAASFNAPRALIPGEFPARIRELEARVAALERKLQDGAAELARARLANARQAERVVALERELSGRPANGAAESHSRPPQASRPEALGRCSDAVDEGSIAPLDRLARGLSASSASSFASVKKATVRGLTTPGCFNDLDPLA